MSQISQLSPLPTLRADASQAEAFLKRWCQYLLKRRASWCFGTSKKILWEREALGPPWPLGLQAAPRFQLGQIWGSASFHQRHQGSKA